MKLKNLMVLKACVCLAIGFLLLVFPQTLLGLMGATLGAAGLFTAREYGAALIGSLLLTWYARKAGPSQARRAIILDLFVYDAIGVLNTLYYTISGVLNWLGWGIIVVYLFFTLGYGYFWFINKDEA
jgi:heme A synthase